MPWQGRSAGADFSVRNQPRGMGARPRQSTADELPGRVLPCSDVTSAVGLASFRASSRASWRLDVDTACSDTGSGRCRPAAPRRTSTAASPVGGRGCPMFPAVGMRLRFGGRSGGSGPLRVIVQLGHWSSLVIRPFEPRRWCLGASSGMAAHHAAQAARQESRSSRNPADADDRPPGPRRWPHRSGTSAVVLLDELGVRVGTVR